MVWHFGIIEQHIIIKNIEYSERIYDNRTLRHTARFELSTIFLTLQHQSSLIHWEFGDSGDSIDLIMTNKSDFQLNTGNRFLVFIWSNNNQSIFELLLDLHMN